MNCLADYLSVRRADWPYDGRYELEQYSRNGFVARIDGKFAGAAWGEDISHGEVGIRMTLKKEYAEYGIGTELLHVLVDHLRDSGCDTIRYDLDIGYYAYQIYEHLGFKEESRDGDGDIVRLVWRR